MTASTPAHRIGVSEMTLDQRELTLLVSAAITIMLCCGSKRFLSYIASKVPLLRATIAAVLIYTVSGAIARLAFPKEIILW